MDRLFLVVIPPLILLTPIVSSIRLLDLPITNTAILELIAVIGLFGVTIGGIAAAFARRTGIWSFITPAALAIAMVGLLDIASVYTPLGIASTRTEKILIFGAGWLICFSIFWLLRSQIAKILFAGAAAFFMSSLVVSPSSADEQKYPVIYIVLDEMIGLNGIDETIANAPEFRELVKSTFLKHGFRIYANAFSRHFMSNRSIPAAINFQWNEDYPGLESKYSRSVRGNTPNALFANAKEHGYRVRITQSAHIDFCSGDEDACVTFPSFNPTGEFVNFGDINDLSELKEDIATLRVLRQSHLASSIVNRSIAFVVRWKSDGKLSDAPDFFDVHSFVGWFENFAEGVLEAPTGTLHFGHFLMPHAPSVLNSKCQIQSRWITPYYLKEQKGLSGAALDSTRVDYYQLYFQQAVCGLREIDKFLTALKSRPVFDNATIVFHGDHGSRISAGRYIENLSDRDMIDNFSTLYAIRKPGLAPGVDARQTSVQRLTTEFFSGRMPEQLGPDNPTVAVDSNGGNSIKLTPMPAIARK